MPRCDRVSRGTPIEQWPRIDREAWQQAISPADLFESELTRASGWKPSTCAMIASAYGYWLAWLSSTGHFTEESAAGEKATLERVMAYRDHMVERGLADFSISGRLKALGDALSAIEPSGSFGWVNLAASRLHSAAKSRKSVRQVMQPAEDVFQLGLDLMQAADHDRFRTECERATMFRDGLLLSFLTLRPLRRANLASLEIADRLQHGDVWRIRIAGEETKNELAIEAPWPQELARALDRYLSKHRRVLLRTAKGSRRLCPALWISRQGGPMTDDALYTQIRRRTEEEFGIAINPHTFRHIAATTIATFRPDEANTIMDVLGHGSSKTAERYYNMAETVGAGVRLHASISEARRCATKRTRRDAIA